jgi:hypothetical protein
MIANPNLYLLLKQIATEQSDIRLMNVYKGLPISHDAHINSVNDSEIHVQSNRHQLACLYHQQETFLQSTEFPFVIRSQVISLHLGRQDATLSNLEIAPNNIGKREQIRVEPDEALTAYIRFNEAPMGIVAPVADISAEGAAVYLEPYMYSPRQCQPGLPVVVSVTLPDTVSQKLKKAVPRPLPGNRSTGTLHPEASIGAAGTVVLSTTGKIASVRSELIGFRVGLRLFFKDLARTVILQYIAQRQSEIIRDLSLLSDELYRLKK